MFNVLISLMKLWLYKIIEADIIKWVKKTEIITEEDRICDDFLHTTLPV